jgi:acetylornithine aminotransferase
MKMLRLFIRINQELSFSNAFHGRTSAAVATTIIKKIVAPINAQQIVFLPLNDVDLVEAELKEMLPA